MSEKPNMELSSSLPNGVSADIIRLNGSDKIHGLMLGEKLFSVVESEAETHGAAFDGSRFNRVLEAAKAGKIQAYFMIVGWENCQPKFAGGAIEFPTVLTEWDGEDFVHYPAVHGEDTFVSPDISVEFRERTKSQEYPHGLGLGTHFMHQRIKLAVDKDAETGPFGMVSRGRIAEFSAHSTAMVKLLSKMNATLGNEADGTILELDRLKPDFQRGWNVPVVTQALGVQASEFVSAHSNIFVTSWASSDEKNRIVATFTDAISTFTGEPIVRVQFTSNGNLPDEETLKDVLGALVMAGHLEIVNRQWDVVADAGPTAIKMRFHALNEPAIAASLKNMGAEPRFLGDHPMLPAITNHSKTASGVLDFAVQKSEPLQIVGASLAAFGDRPSDKEFFDNLLGAAHKSALVA